MRSVIALASAFGSMRPARRARVLPESPLVPPAVRYTGHWAEVLWDLGCLGPVRIESGTEQVRLAQFGALPAIRVGDGVAVARDRRLMLGLFLDRLHALRAEPAAASAVAHPDFGPPRGLRLEDDCGAPLLTLTLAKGSANFGLRTLLGTYGVNHGPALPAAADDLAEPREHLRSGARAPHPVEVRQVRWQALARPTNPAAPTFADIAELCGWLRLDDARLRGRGRAIAIDPAVVPYFLEALTEQTVPVRVTTGNAGVVHGLTDVFHSMRRVQGRLRLLGDDTRFELAADAIDSAWVLIQDEDPGAGPRRQLRLYDEDGQALALLDAVPTRAGQESPLWRVLVNALLD
jgi:putative heme degradation protein